MNQWMRLLALLMTFCLLLPVAVAEEAEAELSLSVSQAELSAGQSVTITCELPHDGRMCLHVLDAEGQEGATLIAETDVQAGETAYVWDGTADGEMVPGGCLLFGADVGREQRRDGDHGTGERRCDSSILCEPE